MIRTILALAVCVPVVAYAGAAHAVTVDELRAAETTTRYCQDHSDMLLNEVQDMYQDMARLHGLEPVDLDDISTVTGLQASGAYKCHMTIIWSDDRRVAGTFTMAPSKARQGSLNSQWHADHQPPHYAQ